METKKLKNYKVFKQIQLIVLICLTITFFLVIIRSTSIRFYILNNPEILAIFFMTWVVLFVSFLYLLYDFRKIELYIKQEHHLKREAYLDDLTGIPNRHYFDTVLKIGTDGFEIKDTGCALLSIENLVEINASYGHEVGDIIIKNLSSILESVGSKSGFIARNGGNEFLAIINHATEEVMANLYNDIISQLAEKNQDKTKFPDIRISFFYLLNSETKVQKVSELITLTYKKKNAKAE